MCRRQRVPHLPVPGRGFSLPLACLGLDSRGTDGRGGGERIDTARARAAREAEVAIFAELGAPAVALCNREGTGDLASE